MAAAPSLLPSRYEQAEVVAAIKQTVAKGATDAQLRMFLEVCKRTGLDPFLKEVWYVPEKGIVMAARDGYLRVANESPQFDGMETRVTRDERNVPIKAVCTVWRKDRNHPIVCEAYYSEYAKPSPVWKQYPSAMISKVAEVLALKRSFAINGTVTEEEIGYDGRGSVEAAQQVAQLKIAAMRKPQPAAAIAETIPEPQDEDSTPYTYEEPESELEVQLAESIGIAMDCRPLQIMTDAFAALEARYRAIGFAPTYGAILGRYCVQRADQFTDMDEARSCYREMSIDVAKREAAHAKKWGGR